MTDEMLSAEVDANAIYLALGRYVVAFQSLHNLLLQICWFLDDPTYGDDARRELVDLGFYSMVSETGRRVYEALVSQGREQSEFAHDFHALLGKCRKLGKTRNRIVHSAYVHLEGFGRLYGVVRADVRQGPARSLSIDSESLTPDGLDGRLKEIADTYLWLSLSRTQLIHWHGRNSRPG